MENRLYLVIGTLVVIAVSSCSTPTPESTQIQQLNRQSVGWKDKRNWQKIQDNMSPQQVTAILGQPTREEKLGSFFTLFW